VCALDEDARRKTVRVDGFVDESLVPEGIGVNALVSPDVSDLGGGNVLYSTRVELEPASDAEPDPSARSGTRASDGSA
ncbi:MAG: hypothetical protein AAFP86_19355, partial [Planctomycetota bacterium]